MNVIMLRLMALRRPDPDRCKVCGQPTRQLWKRGGEWTFVDVPCKCKAQPKQ